MAKASKLPLYFKPLFWSYNFSLLDPTKDKRLIIIKTINYGKWEHWQWMIKYYGKKEIKKIVEATRVTEFRPRVLRLISLLLSIRRFNYALRGPRS